jgi:hypothetical protein
LLDLHRELLAKKKQRHARAYEFLQGVIDVYRSKYNKKYIRELPTEEAKKVRVTGRISDRRTAAYAIYNAQVFNNSSWKVMAVIIEVRSKEQVLAYAVIGVGQGPDMHLEPNTLNEKVRAKLTYQVKSTFPDGRFGYVPIETSCLTVIGYPNARLNWDDNYSKPSDRWMKNSPATQKSD